MKGPLPSPAEVQFQGEGEDVLMRERAHQLFSQRLGALQLLARRLRAPLLRPRQLWALASVLSVGAGLVAARVQAGPYPIDREATIKAIELELARKAVDLQRHFGVSAEDQKTWREFMRIQRRLRSHKLGTPLIQALLKKLKDPKKTLTAAELLRAKNLLGGLSAEGLSPAAAQQSLNDLAGLLGSSPSSVSKTLGAQSLAQPSNGALSSLAANVEMAVNNKAPQNQLSLGSLGPSIPVVLGIDEPSYRPPPFDPSKAFVAEGLAKGSASSSTGLPTRSASALNPKRGPAGSLGSGPRASRSGGSFSLPSHSLQGAGSSLGRALGAVTSRPITYGGPSPRRPAQENLGTGAPSRSAPKARPSQAAVPRFDFREFLGGDFASLAGAQRERRRSSGGGSGGAGGPHASGPGSSSAGSSSRRVPDLGPECPHLATLKSSEICQRCARSDACACQKDLEKEFAFTQSAQEVAQKLGRQVDIVRKGLEADLLGMKKHIEQRDQKVYENLHAANVEHNNKKHIPYLIKNSAFLNGVLGMQSSACALTQNYARPDADSLRHVEWLPRNQGPQKSCQHFDSSNLSRWASVSDRARVLGFVKSLDLLLFAGKKEALELPNGDTISNTQDALDTPLAPAALAENLFDSRLYNPEHLGLKGPQGRNHIQENLLGCSGQNQWGEVLDNLEAELRPLAMGCNMPEARYIQQLRPSDSKSRFCSYNRKELSKYRRSQVEGADPSVASMGKSRNPASWSQEAVSHSSFRKDFSALVGLRGPALKDCEIIIQHYRFILMANIKRLKAKEGESPCGPGYQSDGPSNTHHQERNTL